MCQGGGISESGVEEFIPSVHGRRRQRFRRVSWNKRGAVRHVGPDLPSSLVPIQRTTGHHTDFPSALGPMLIKGGSTLQV